MLILSRKVGSVTKIGEAMVKILEIGRDGVRLGIEAPKEVLVIRDNARIKTVRAALANGTLAKCEEALDHADN
jgi:carbon storage regulator CsrA